MQKGKHKNIYAYLGMYSILIVAEFCTVFMEDPVKDDPENAAAGAARVRATREAVFMLFERSNIMNVVGNLFFVEAERRTK